MISRTNQIEANRSKSKQSKQSRTKRNEARKFLINCLDLGSCASCLPSRGIAAIDIVSVHSSRCAFRRSLPAAFLIQVSQTQDITAFEPVEMRRLNMDGFGSCRCEASMLLFDAEASRYPGAPAPGFWVIRARDGFGKARMRRMH